MGFVPKTTTEAGAVSFFFHRIFLTIAVQEGPAVKLFDLGVDGVRAERVNIDLLWGLKQLSDVRVVTIS